MAFVPRRIEPADWASFDLLQMVIDTIPDPIFVKDLEHRWIALNQGFCKLIGQRYEALIGRSDPDYWPAEQAATFWRLDDEVFQTGEPNENEEEATGADGVPRTIWTRKFPLRNAAGAVIGLCGIITDITDIKERLKKAERLEAELQEQRRLIDAQNALIDALTMPVVEIWDGILLVPLVGALSERRAAKLTESLLAAIVRSGARYVLLDVTGVPGVDARVASHLVRAVRAADLLGCKSVLCGIGPEIAAALVTLDVDFGRVSTQGTLRDGLAHAMDQVAAGGDPRRGRARRS